jgi:hypothetical protein
MIVYGTFGTISEFDEFVSVVLRWICVKLHTRIEDKKIGKLSFGGANSRKLNLERTLICSYI